MNFTFADLSNSILSMVQQDMPVKVSNDLKNADSKNQMFAEKLGRMLEKTQSSKETDLPTDVLPKAPTQKSEDVIEYLGEKLTKDTGVQFIAELKKLFLVLTKGNLKNLSIDEQGLETLKKLLSKAGFGSEELDTLMAELTEKLDTKKLSLDEVFESLFNLEFESDQQLTVDSENFLPISDLPFIESLLISFQIPNEQIQEILVDADAGEKGINLDIVIEKLQQLQKQSFLANNPYRVQDGDKNVSHQFEQLGLDVQRTSSGGITLNELVQAFENLRASQSANSLEKNASSSNNTVLENKTGTLATAAGNEKTTDLLKDLFNGLKIENQPEKKQGTEFSQGQIKDQFKGDVPLNIKDGVAQKDLFGKQQTKKAAKAQIAKEMAAVLEEKNQGASTPKNGVEDAKGFVKQMKAKTTGLGDQSQPIASETKTTDSQAGQAILKTKASFKNLPTFVTQQVSKSIVRAINQGENTLRIQLKPPELGRLVMTIDNSGNSMKVNIVTENAAAREILVSNANELKTVLSNSGVNLEKFDVDMNSDFRQSMADAKHQAGHNSKKGQNRAKQMFDPVTGERVIDPLDLINIQNPDGSLHFVA